MVLPAVCSVSEMAAEEDQLRLVLEDSDGGFCFASSSERTRFDLSAGSELASVFTLFPSGPTSALGKGLTESVSGPSVPSGRRPVSPVT